MDWVLLVGVIMAGIALILSVWVVVMMRGLANDILDRLDAKIIEEVVEAVPTRSPGPDSPAYRGGTRVYPSGVIVGESAFDLSSSYPPDVPTHKEQVERTMKRRPV
jgi:hypothetical protein